MIENYDFKSSGRFTYNVKIVIVSGVTSSVRIDISTVIFHYITKQRYMQYKFSILSSQSWRDINISSSVSVAVLPCCCC